MTNVEGPLRWGLISAGKISHDFSASFHAYLLPKKHVILGVAARNKDSAVTFAKEHNIPKVYDSYEALTKDPEVDVVYIGSIHPEHLSLCKLALGNGKHVLCEKPLCVNTRETKEVIEFARKQKRFFMEALWPRFFPAYAKLREEIKSGVIGDVLQVTAGIGVIFPEDNWRTCDKDANAGSVLDIGTYTAQLASFVYDGEKPLKISASGHMNEHGADESSSATLIYSKGRTATLTTHIRVNFPNDAYVIGTKGTIRVVNKFWSPTVLETPTGTYEFPLPVTDKKLYFQNSEGLAYQCDEVWRCIKAGLLESPLISHEESITLAEIREDIRKQIGVIYPQDLI